MTKKKYLELVNYLIANLNDLRYPENMDSKVISVINKMEIRNMLNELEINQIQETFDDYGDLFFKEAKNTQDLSRISSQETIKPKPF